jgi:hypothetical protein
MDNFDKYMELKEIRDKNIDNYSLSLEYLKKMKEVYLTLSNTEKELAKYI